MKPRLTALDYENELLQSVTEVNNFVIINFASQDITTVWKQTMPPEGA